MLLLILASHATATLASRQHYARAAITDTMLGRFSHSLIGIAVVMSFIIHIADTTFNITRLIIPSFGHYLPIHAHYDTDITNSSAYISLITATIDNTITPHYVIAAQSGHGDTPPH